MPVVADANVIVSAAPASSPRAASAVTLSGALDSRRELIISPQFAQAIAMVLARPRLWKHLSTAGALRFVTDLAGQMTPMADLPCG
jgi:hypothetical protein